MLGLGFLGLSAPSCSGNIFFPLGASWQLLSGMVWREIQQPEKSHVPGVPGVAGRAPPRFPAPLEHWDIWQEQVDLMVLVIKWGQLNEVAAEALPREIIPEGILLPKSGLGSDVQLPLPPPPPSPGSVR